ncbi:ankyrin repeat domain-containing protein [Halanaerobacter jeridensis]|uniref:Ankyrin repeat protein n=1 Tax=Halanaerobacter jeridensis TaxID=706427 RepID=A0A938XUP1_9FIRM|nr:ankyrin repeat domain-containing protein [Halanaerobacter jeridensis]MBM7558121.1 ankyrin repeat protein [Halanaerobacter jeridensis]
MTNKKKLLTIGIIAILVLSFSFGIKAEESELFKAVKQNNVTKVKELIKSGVNINKTSEYYNIQVTPLILALHKGHSKIGKLLIKAGTKVNWTTKNDITALDFAEKPQVVKLLLKNGANFDDKNIIIAIKNKNSKKAKILLKNSDNFNVNAVDDTFGRTALMYAAKNGDLGMVNKLIKKGANVNYKTKEKKGTLRKEVYKGVTALMYAAKNGDVDMINKLIEEGADVTAKDNMGRTALMMAVMNPEAVKLLIKKGANVNVKSDKGKTALMYAAAARNIKSIKILLANEANANARDNKGRTALDFAVLERDSRIVKREKKIAKMLIKNGLKSKTALFKSIDKERPEVVEILIEEGADVNVRTDDGRTALMKAIGENNSEIVKVLIKGGANVNAKDNNGQTALMKAVNKRNKYVVKMLIENGANVNAKDNKGQTALDILENLNFEKNKVIFEILIAASEEKK